ncbi:MAG: hypothetical protein JXA04_00765 [Gammaproteobacteria bacterium]|nr:hypothetical protein [Gammaproteobacteria bacterium]
MKNIIGILIGVPLVALLSVPTFAQDLDNVDVGEITMDVSDNARTIRNEHRNRIRNVVYQYMLENGDITQAELDARLALRETHREELRALREAGDKEGLAARIAELKQERAAHREQMREYINAHEDLATALQEQRREFQERRREGAGPGDGGQGPGNGGGNGA